MSSPAHGSERKWSQNILPTTSSIPSNPGVRERQRKHLLVQPRRMSRVLHAVTGITEKSSQVGPSRGGKRRLLGLSVSRLVWFRRRHRLGEAIRFRLFGLLGRRVCVILAIAILRSLLPVSPTIRIDQSLHAAPFLDLPLQPDVCNRLRWHVRGQGYGGVWEKGHLPWSRSHCNRLPGPHVDRSAASWPSAPR